MRNKIGILFLFIIMFPHVRAQSGASCCEAINLTQEELTLQVDSGSVWFYALSSLANYDVTFRPNEWDTIVDSSDIEDRQLLINYLVVCYCEDGPHYDSIYIHYWPEEEIEELMEKDNENIAAYNSKIRPLRVADSIPLDSLSASELSALKAEDIVYQIYNLGLNERIEADLGGYLNEAHGYIEMVFPMPGTLTLVNRSENITCQQNTIFLTYGDTAIAMSGQLYRMCPVRDITEDGVNIIYYGTEEANIFMYRNCKRELFEIEDMIHPVSLDGYWLTLQPNSGIETLINLHDFALVYWQYRQFFFEVNTADPNACFKVVNSKTPSTDSYTPIESQQSAAPYKIIREGHVFICMPDGTIYDLLGRKI